MLKCLEPWIHVGLWAPTGPGVQIGPAPGTQPSASLPASGCDRQRQEELLADDVREIDLFIRSDGDDKIFRAEPGLPPA